MKIYKMKNWQWRRNHERRWPKCRRRRRRRGKRIPPWTWYRQPRWNLEASCCLDPPSSRPSLMTCHPAAPIHRNPTPNYLLSFSSTFFVLRIVLYWNLLSFYVTRRVFDIFIKYLFNISCFGLVSQKLSDFLI